MTFTRDLLERAVRTFVQAALAVAAADLAGLTSVDGAKALFISAVAAGLSAVMSLLARNVGAPDSPSVLSDSTEVPSQVEALPPQAGGQSDDPLGDDIV